MLQINGAPDGVYTGKTLSFYRIDLVLFTFSAAGLDTSC